MHPFGGTHLCPKCEKAVYAAEQVMGPGRKLYHKPCLSCTFCNKRLDSYTLLEHDQKPYCKPCHLRNFGTRDLRQANLPNREREPSPPAPDPDPNLLPPPPCVPPPIRTQSTPSIMLNATGNAIFPPRLRPNRSLVTSPLAPTFTDRSVRAEPEGDAPADAPEGEEGQEHEETAGGTDTEEELDIVAASLHPTSSPPPPSSINNAQTSAGSSPFSAPRAVLSRSGATSGFSSARHQPSKSLASIVSFKAEPGSDVASAIENEIMSAATLKPLTQTATGTRYGAALGGALPVQFTGSPRRPWGAANPICPRCGKSVYFAEQAKAVGKTFHKACLRCTECNTLLDSSRLRDHDGEPICMRCYGKLHGPQGSGYALLGKAGG